MCVFKESAAITPQMLRLIYRTANKKTTDIMKRILVFIFALACAVSAFAQSGKVTFSVIDKQQQIGLPGAVVEVYPTAKPDNKRYYTSGADGFTSIPGLAYGKYTMVITFIGYKDVTKEFALSGASLSLGKVYIEEAAERIEKVVKTAKALRTSQNGDTLSYSAGAFKVPNDISRRKEFFSSIFRKKPI